MVTRTYFSTLLSFSGWPAFGCPFCAAVPKTTASRLTSTTVATLTIAPLLYDRTPSGHSMLDNITTRSQEMRRRAHVPALVGVPVALIARGPYRAPARRRIPVAAVVVAVLLGVRVAPGPHHVDEHVGRELAEPLDALFHHPPLEVVVAGRRWRHHGEVEREGVAGRDCDARGYVHAAEVPRQVVLRVLRAQPVAPRDPV